MIFFLQKLGELICCIKYPKKTVAAIYNSTLESNAEIKRGAEKLHEIKFDDLVGTDYPSVYPFTFLGDSSTVTDILLLNGLARRIPNCNFLEIGTWRGESILNVARYAKSCTSISLSKDHILEKFGQKYADVINFYFNQLNPKNVKLIGADSKEFDFNSLNDKYDLIFIDGDHSYEGIVNDTKKAISCLKDKNSIIVWHDYSFGAEKIRYNTLNAILNSVPKEYHKNLYHVEDTMCAILYFNEIDSHEHIDFPRIPTNTYEITIKKRDPE